MNFLYVFERFVRSMDTTRLIRGKEKKQRKEKKKSKAKKQSKQTPVRTCKLPINYTPSIPW